MTIIVGIVCFIAGLILGLLDDYIPPRSPKDWRDR